MKATIFLLAGLLLSLLAESAPAQNRTWTDASGQFSVEAKCLGIADGKVRLLKKDGEIVSIPLEKLSQSDREFLAAAGVLTTLFGKELLPIRRRTWILRFVISPQSLVSIRKP